MLTRLELLARGAALLTARLREAPMVDEYDNHQEFQSVSKAGVNNYSYFYPLPLFRTARYPRERRQTLSVSVQARLIANAPSVLDGLIYACVARGVPRSNGSNFSIGFGIGIPTDTPAHPLIQQGFQPVQLANGDIGYNTVAADTLTTQVLDCDSLFFYCQFQVNPGATDVANAITLSVGSRLFVST